MQAILELTDTVARLRGPGGCPWDQEQNHQSICDCLIEECAELLETIDRMDMEHMREELGDLLLHVVMHAQMAAEAGHFDLGEVARGINEKLIRRHPHVFGDMDLKDTDAVLNQWEKIKAGEKRSSGSAPGNGPFKNLPPRLPALLHARDLLKQIARKSLPVDGLVEAGNASGLTETEAGRQLFNAVEACRRAGIDPESALRRYAARVQDEVELRVNQTRTAGID